MGKRHGPYRISGVSDSDTRIGPNLSWRTVSSRIQVSPYRIRRGGRGAVSCNYGFRRYSVLREIRLVSDTTQPDMAIHPASARVILSRNTHGVGHTNACAVPILLTLQQLAANEIMISCRYILWGRLLSTHLMLSFTLVRDHIRESHIIYMYWSRDTHIEVKANVDEEASAVIDTSKTHKDNLMRYHGLSCNPFIFIGVVGVYLITTFLGPKSFIKSCEQTQSTNIDVQRVQSSTRLKSLLPDEYHSWIMSRDCNYQPENFEFVCRQANHVLCNFMWLNRIYVYFK